jgi:hypothetical protein
MLHHYLLFEGGGLIHDKIFEFPVALGVVLDENLQVAVKGTENSVLLDQRSFLGRPTDKGLEM